MELISSSCAKQDFIWRKRSRKIRALDILIFLLHAVGLPSSSFTKVIAGLSTFGRKPYSRSSMVDARKKIGWGFWRRLLFQVSQFIEETYSDRHLWRGHHVYTIDGSKINLPRELKKSKYKGSHPGCFYPQGLLCVLMRLRTRTPIFFELFSKVGEGKFLKTALTKVRKNGVVVYDRLYFCWDAIVTHKKQALHGVFRLKTGGTLKEVLEFIESGKQDETRVIERKGKSYKLRFVRYQVKGQDYYLATTLLSSKKYPIAALKDLYHSRWGIEETFKFIKQELKLEKFHSKSPAGVKQEIAVSLILAALTGIARIYSGRKKQPSQGVINQQIVNNAEELLHFPNRTQVEKHLKISMKTTHQALENRSFERRSRKVINRWQRNISKEWEKRKRSQAKALGP